MGNSGDLPPTWLEAVQDVLYVIRLSPDFAFEFISDAVSDLVGYTPAEHYADPDLGARIVDPRDLNRMAAMTKVPPGQRLEVTLRWVTRDGKPIWTQHRCVKQIRPDGSTALIGSARDVTEQVRDREALAAAREQYRLIAENASDVVFRGTNEGRLEWISDSVSDVLGWSPHELTGQPFIDLVHPEDHRVVRETQAGLTAGRPGRFEVRLRSHTGKWRWIAVSVRPVFDSSGSVVGRVGGWQDIQNSVTLRDALSSSESMFRTMMEHSTVGAILTDASGHITTVTEAACEILGCTRQTLLGRDWHELVHEQDRGTARKAFNDVVVGKRANVRAIRRLTGSAHGPLWVDASLTRLHEHNQFTACLIQIYDVTQAVADRDALHQSREEYRFLAENAADVVLRLGAQAQITWISPSVKRLTGYEIEEVLDRSVLEFVHPLDVERAATALSRLFDGSAQSATEEVRIQHADGAYASWQATARMPVDQVILTLRNIETEVSARAAAALEQTRRSAAVQSMLDPHLLLVAVRHNQTITDFRIADLNDAACAALGRDRSHLVDQLMSEHAKRLSSLGLFEPLASVVQSGQALVIDGMPVSNTTGPRFLDVRAVRVWDEAVSLTWRDVTDRHQLLADLEDSRARYRAIMQSELEPHITMRAVRDQSGTIVDFQYLEANPAALDYLGLKNEAISQTTLRTMYPSAAAAELLAMYAHTVETGEPLIADDYVYPNEMFSGEARWYDLRGAKLGDGLSLAWRDVTEKHQAAERLARSERRYRLLAENAAQVVFRLDAAGRFSFCTDGVQRGLGWSAAQLMGSAMRDLVHPDDLDVLEEMTDDCAPELFGPARLRLRTASQGYRWQELTGRRIAEGGGLVGGWRDVTAEVHAQRALETQARHDDLTGLLNRSEARVRLQAALRESSELSVLYLDLDNLKDINDTNGHAAGDRALKITAQRIMGWLHDGDLAARIGGDEFLVMIPAGRDALAAAMDLRACLETPIPSEMGPLTSTVSIGLTRAIANDTVDALIARADQAMYQAKAAGRNQLVVL